MVCTLPTRFPNLVIWRPWPCRKKGILHLTWGEWFYTSLTVLAAIPCPKGAFASTCNAVIEYLTWRLIRHRSSKTENINSRYCFDKSLTVLSKGLLASTCNAVIEHPTWRLTRHRSSKTENINSHYYRYFDSCILNRITALGNLNFESNLSHLKRSIIIDCILIVRCTTFTPFPHVPVNIKHVKI
jgi:hypothetical protein